MIRDTELGMKNCIESNQKLGEKSSQLLKPSTRKCKNCSLLDAGAPIIVEGRHIATWIVGQSPSGSLDRTTLENYAADIGVTFAELDEVYAELHRIPLHKFE